METILEQPRDKNIIEILNRYGFFRTACHSLQHEILSKANMTVLKPHFRFFQRGSQSKQLALIGTGSVRVFILGEGGREVTLYHVLPGDACPINMLSILLCRETPAFAIVESQVRAIVIDAAYFRKWISEHSVIRNYVFETIASRMADIFSLLENLKFRKLETRLAEYLVKQLPRPELNSAVIRITHERIASELGSAREVISRLLRDYERKGVLELARGRIFVNNKQALQKIVEE